ncbi:EscJ/YscJ/HrcJ family type III secretion inner membrane ring protein [Glaciimonas immobilis]|nr:EscJ/YscJ/HrcJ family type III secretion inner membrane ring protein [Glaciimonas immobilis]
MKTCVWILICIVLAGCKQENLLQSLEQKQANEVVAILHRNNIDGQKQNNGKSGFSVDVQKADFAAAVDILKAYDLPSRNVIEVADMFPIDSLVASPRAEKARLYSAIEQRLEQSLNTISGVVTARVHVSYDLDGAERGKKNRPIHLSSLITYEEAVDSQALVNSVKRFLKNSFDEVDYDNISVVLSKRDILQNAPTQIVKKQAALPSAGWLGAITALLLAALGGAFWYWRRQGQLGSTGGSIPRNGWYGLPPPKAALDAMAPVRAPSVQIAQEGDSPPTTKVYHG